jgi:hypothetical protein
MRHHVIGRRHNGMPTWDEVKGKKRSYEPTKLPIQPKEIGSVSLAVLLALRRRT